MNVALYHYYYNITTNVQVQKIKNIYCIRSVAFYFEGILEIKCLKAFKNMLTLFSCPTQSNTASAAWK